MFASRASQALPVAARNLVAPEVLVNGPDLATLEQNELHEFEFTKIEDGDGSYFNSLSGQHSIQIGDLLGAIEFLATLDMDGSVGERMLSNHVIDFALFFHYRLDRHSNIRVLSTSQTRCKRDAVNRRWENVHERERALVHQLRRLNYETADIAPLTITSLKLTQLERIFRAGLAPNRQPYLIDQQPSRERGTVAAVVFPEREKDRAHFSFVVVDARSPVRAEYPDVIHFDTLRDSQSKKRAKEIYKFCRDAFVSPMTVPFSYKAARVKQRDGWSCGYQVLSRLNDVVNRLAQWRTYIEDGNRFADESHLLDDKGFVGLLDVTESQCRALHKTLLKKATLLYLHAKQQWGSHASKSL